MSIAYYHRLQRCFFSYLPLFCILFTAGTSAFVPLAPAVDSYTFVGISQPTPSPIIAQNFVIRQKAPAPTIAPDSILGVGMPLPEDGKTIFSHKPIEGYWRVLGSIAKEGGEEIKTVFYAYKTVTVVNSIVDLVIAIPASTPISNSASTPTSILASATTSTPGLNSVLILPLSPENVENEHFEAGSAMEEKFSENNKTFPGTVMKGKRAVRVDFEQGRKKKIMEEIMREKRKPLRGVDIFAAVALAIAMCYLFSLLMWILAWYMCRRWHPRWGINTAEDKSSTGTYIDDSDGWVGVVPRRRREMDYASSESDFDVLDWGWKRAGGRKDVRELFSVAETGRSPSSGSGC
ncbi:hypothetical protein RUND412_003472 [Rhizina undulata]